jgi:hypothetical protein
MSTRKKMLRDEGYRKDYVACMDKLLEKGYATRSDASPKGRTWYIPHHGVRQNQQKFRVVFDCAASYQGRCLNDELLQGPDLTNADWCLTPLPSQQDCFHG